MLKMLLMFNMLLMLNMLPMLNMLLLLNMLLMLNMFFYDDYVLNNVTIGDHVLVIDLFHNVAAMLIVLMNTK